jgi:hypothetical protein
MKTSRIALAAPFALLAACSSSNGSGIVTERMHAEPEDAGTSDAPAPDSAILAAPKKDAAPPPVEPPGECEPETTQTACVSCCSAKHEDGAGVYYVALIDCMCLPANCQKACETTLCDLDDTKNPDAACNACITARNGSCAATTTAACTADPGCVAFDACVDKSKCVSKTN